MNDVDWDALFTSEQMQHARTLAAEDGDNPRLRDLLITEVLIGKQRPEGVERDLNGGFLRSYGGYHPNTLGRLLMEYVTGD